MSLEDREDAAPAATEDKILPVLAYILYLIGLTQGLTILVAVIIAYANRAKAGPIAASHYEWIIRTFWLSIGLLLFSVLLILVGIPLSLIGVGLFLIAGGMGIYSLIALWTMVRCVLGLIYLSRDEVYPRPRTLLF